MGTFNPAKATQAAAYLLSLEHGAMTRLRLLKLLYIADRECLAETLCPITYDKAAAMDNGPVLSRIYDYIKGQGEGHDVWQRHIRTTGPRRLELTGDPGKANLSRYELSKLAEVVERFAAMDDYEVADHTHSYAEWAKNTPLKGSRNNISFDDRLEAVGLGEVEKGEIVGNHREDIAFAKLLKGACG